METIWQDLRYAVRSLAKQPVFTLIVVLTLAVGVGANTAIFSVVNATLLRPFSFKDPNRLMTVSITTPSMHGGPPRDNSVWSYPKYQTFRELQRVFEDVALYGGRTCNLTGVEQAEHVVAHFWPRSRNGGDLSGAHLTDQCRKPDLSKADPERPRSSLMTAVCLRPNSRARSTHAYWRL